MLGLLRAFKETDADDEFFRRWAGAAQSLHGTIFGFIESLIVLAALQLAAFATASWLVWGLYFAGYGALVVVSSICLRVAFMLLVNRTRMRGWPRNAALWACGLGAVAINTWLVGALSDVLAEIGRAGLANLSLPNPPAGL